MVLMVVEWIFLGYLGYNGISPTNGGLYNGFTMVLHGSIGMIMG